MLQSGSFNALNILNCDETGFLTVSTKGARQVRKVSSAERGANVTALCCMNAAGTYVPPPLFVFPRKSMIASLMNAAPGGSIAASINGDRAT